MSNYPAMVNDDHDHFTDNTEPDDEEPEPFGTSDLAWEAHFGSSRTDALLTGWIWPKDSIEAASYEYEFAHGDILSLQG